MVSEPILIRCDRIDRISATLDRSTLKVKAIFYVFVVVNKSHEKTQTNNVLVRLSHYQLYLYSSKTHVICCLHSKSARRKKREEAQKLPEVSKEIYYDVSGDLKAVFGATKDDVAGGEEKTNWDQEEEEEGGGKEEQPTPLSSLLSADPSAENEESSGFKFSFFGDDTETGSGETGTLYLRCLSQAVRGKIRFHYFFKSLSPSASRVQGREHPGAKGVMATRPTFPRQQLRGG